MKSEILYINIFIILGTLSTYYISRNQCYLDHFILQIMILLIIFFALKLVNIEKQKIVIYLLAYFLATNISLLRLNKSQLKKFTGKKIIMHGEIIEAGIKKDEAVNYIFKVDKIIDSKKEKPLKEKIRLKIIDSEEVFELGTRLMIRSEIKEPGGRTNPKLYDFKKSLLSKDIHIYTSNKLGDILKIEENKKISYKLANLFIQGVNNKLKDLREENKRFINGVILGNYDLLSEDEVDTYRDLGLAHLLAVSGLHIGIITGFIIKLLSIMGLGRKFQLIISFFTIWLYGYLIGFPLSILRACLMISFIFLGEILFVPVDRLNNLYLSMFILLCINPFYIFNLSFILSYCAAFALLFLNSRIEKHLYIGSSFIRNSISPLLAIQIILLPIQAYYFNKISILSIAANLIVVPIVSIAVPIAFLVLLIPKKIGLLILILDVILSLENTLVEVLNSIKLNILNIRSPEIWEIFLYYLGVIIIFKIVDFRDIGVKTRKIFILLSILIILSVGSKALDRSLYIHFIDVGQGDSILIEKDGRRYLIDTGGNLLGDFNICGNITLPYLRKQGFHRLDGLFISHYHEDHCKGGPLLLKELKINRVLLPYIDKENKLCSEILKNASNTYILNRGNKLNLAKDLSIEVLNPEKDKVSSLNENNRSLVMLLKYKDKKILMTGDMESEIEDSILLGENLDKIKNIDIIKVAHHGSNTSSTEGFIKTVRPKIAVIMVGRKNIYSLPKDDVLNNYHQVKTHIYRTDKDGFIKIKLNNKKIFIDRFLSGKDIGLDTIIPTGVSILNGCLIFYIFKKERATLDI